MEKIEKLKSLCNSTELTKEIEKEIFKLYEEIPSEEKKEALSIIVKVF